MIAGSIRLNDLLNDEDDYGFAEEATEVRYWYNMGFQQACNL